MVQVIVINGYPGSGKDLFTEYCKLHAPANCTVFHISTVDPTKEALTLLGWNGEKTNEMRDLLSSLKVASTNLFDGPYRYVCKTVQELKVYAGRKCVVFVDSREPEEIQRFVDTMGASTLYISRTPKGQLPSNYADNAVENYKYDRYIENEGTMAELSEKAMEFLYSVLGKMHELEEEGVV